MKIDLIKSLKEMNLRRYWNYTCDNFIKDNIYDIIENNKNGISLKNIYKQLVKEDQIWGSYSSFLRRVRKVMDEIK